MAKLYFKYGVMGSCKTVQALTADFNYKAQGMKTLLVKPRTDNRGGEETISSRIGLSAKADIVLSADDKVSNFTGRYDVVIVDEAQFLTEAQIDDLRRIADKMNIPVLCYGLRTDFQTHLFEGSKRLLEIADTIQEETKFICKCGKKATVNARKINGKVVLQGEQVVIGGNESYESMCSNCFRKLGGYSR